MVFGNFIRRNEISCSKKLADQIKTRENQKVDQKKDGRLLKMKEKSVVLKWGKI